MTKLVVYSLIINDDILWIICGREHQAAEGGGGETCVYVAPIPPLRLNKIMAWRLQEIP